MFKNLVSTLKAKHLRDLAAKGELVCPECGKKAALVPDGEVSALKCDTCGVTSLPEEWINAGKGMAFVGDADSPPAATTIIRNDNGAGTVTWSIPASGRGCFLLFFGIFWCSITALVSGGFLFAALTGTMKEGGDFPKWAMIPFFGIFWAIGIGVLYAGLRARYARHLLTADGQSITLRREFFGRVKEKSIDCGEIESISQKEFYQQNYTPVYGIEIKGLRSKIRFGSVLEMDDKAWLVADLRRVVNGGSPGNSKVESRSAGRQSLFSFPLPAIWKSVLPSAVIAVLMGTFFMVVAGRFIGSWNTPSTRDAPMPWNFFDAIFSGTDAIMKVLFFGTGAAIACVGLWLLVKYIISRHDEIRVEGNEVEIAIRTIRHSRVHRERSFPRASVASARASVMGNSSGTVKKKIALIVDGKSETIGHWVDAPAADEFVRQVNEALG